MRIKIIKNKNIQLRKHGLRNKKQLIKEEKGKRKKKKLLTHETIYERKGFS